MNIVGQAISIPERRVCNDEVLEEVRARSKPYLSKQDLELVIRTLGDALTSTGIRSRSWRLGTETAVDSVREALAQALVLAERKQDDIGTVIYCSIHRGFWEPASASILCDLLGLRPQRAFDILDACMGWMTALEVAESFFSAGEQRLIAVIAVEFPNEDGGAVYPACYKIRHPSEVPYKMAGLTMGEACSVTLLAPGGSSPWKSIRQEFPQFSALCRVPIHGRESCDDAQCEDDPASGPGTFFAEASKLATRGFRPSLAVLRDYVEQFGTPDVIVPHSVSRVLPLRIADQLRLGDQIFTTYPEFGNLATASVPVSATAAVCRNVAGDGASIIGWVASAGMKFGAFPIPLSATAVLRSGSETAPPSDDTRRGKRE